MESYRDQCRAWLRTMLAKRGRGARKELAEFLGVRTDAITRMTNDRPGKEQREITAEELIKMAEFFEEAPPMPPLPSGQRKLISSFDPDQPDENLETAAAINHDQRIGVPAGEIPQIDAHVGLGMREDVGTIQIPVGGGGAVMAARVIDTWKIPESVMRRRIRGSLRSIHIVECEGDSMEPRIRDGDFVFIDTSRREPSPPGIFALHDGFAQTLKKVELIPNSDPPRLRIIPENEKYATYERLLEEVNIIGRYVCRLTAD